MPPTASATRRGSPPDDFTPVVGIGDVINGVLHGGGIRTWEQLANASPEQIRPILQRAGLNTQLHDPAEWPARARAEMRERGLAGSA